MHGMASANGTGGYIPITKGGFSVPNSPVDVRGLADLNYYATSVLPEDAQRVVTDQVVRVSTDRLVLVQDLIEAGLTIDLDDWWATTEVAYDMTIEAGEAEHAMVPGVQGTNFRNLYDRKVTPVHCTFENFHLNIRELRASIRAGRPLDTSHIATATRKVNEKVEHQGFYGSGFKVSGNTAEGIMKTTDTFEFSASEGWDDTGHSGEDIYDDIKRGIQKMYDKGKNGPFNIYISPLYSFKLGDDWKANSDKSIIARLTETPYGGRPLRFRAVDSLRSKPHHIAIVQMTDDTIRLINGQSPTPYSWNAGNPFMFDNVVLACEVVQVVYDANGDTGIVIGHKTGT